MIKICIKLFLIINVLNSNAQIINIPDVNFKNRLLESSTTNNTAKNSQYQNIKIDSNNNGEIEQNEALQVYLLSVTNSNIYDLTGLEYFTNLFWVGIGSNQITNVNLSYLINLQTISCENSQLLTIDFSGLNNLKRAYLQDNLFTNLDFSNNPLFDELQCSNNPNLTTLKINNNFLQKFTPTYAWLPINWTNLPNLSTICADSFEVADLQSFLVSCGITQPITINTSCTLDNDVFETSNISIYPNPSNGLFTVDFGNSIETANLMIYNMLGQEVYSENIKNATTKTLNLEHLSKGTYVLKYVENSLVESRKILIK